MHTLNMVLELLDPKYVDSLLELKASVRAGKNGDALKDVHSHLGGMAVHWNLMLKAHLDRKALHLGMDAITGFGRYERCRLKFPTIGIEFDFDRGDTAYLRDAGLMHQATGWVGDGHMVVVPFLERRVFGWENVKRPKQRRRPFGSHYDGFRKDFPAQSVSKLLKPLNTT